MEFVLNFWKSFRILIISLNESSSLFICSNLSKNLLKSTGQLGKIFLIKIIFSSLVYLKVDIIVNLDFDASEKLFILSKEEMPIILKLSEKFFISLSSSVNVSYKSSLRISFGD